MSDLSLLNKSELETIFRQTDRTKRIITYSRHFDELVSIPWNDDLTLRAVLSLTSKHILSTLSLDLSAIDLSIVEKNFPIIDKLLDEKDFFFELAVICKDKAYSHPEWSLLAGRVRMVYIKRNIPKTFSQATEKMKPLLNNGYYQFCEKNALELDLMVDYNLDWNLNIFAVETLYNSYLTKIKDEIGNQFVIEGIQHMYMRIAVFLWYPDIDTIKIAYHDYSRGIISGPSPLQFNAGLKRPQLASCFVAGTKVMTVRGKISIEDVKINDVTMTHKGRMKKVLQLHENLLGERKLYKLSFGKNSSVEVTANHRLWAKKKLGSSLEWISVEDLCTGDYLQYKSNFSGRLEIELTPLLKKEDVTPNNNPTLKVYTLGVEDDHSYCVEGIIAENCFLLAVSDNMKSISKGWHDGAIISMNNGGLGYAYDALRHSEIGHQGWSKGLVPWLKIKNEILATVDQGGSKRKGSGTIYTTDWNIDIYEFIEAKKPTGKEELRARGLFYGIMISDLFMRRVRHDEMWSLVCPAKTNELYKKYGSDFEKAYLDIEKNGLEGKYYHAFRQVKARDLWKHILISQIITGMPFIVYKDAVNRKTNQKNLGTIRSSNLCVHGDTKILTKQGQIPIKELVGKNIEIWNGEEWSLVTPFKTGENKNLLKVKLDNGLELDCTPEHKFYVRGSDNEEIVTEAKNLIVGQRLIKFRLPKTDNIEDIKDELHNLYYKQNKTKKEALELLYLLQTIGIKSSLKLQKNSFHIVLPPHEMYKLGKLGFYTNFDENKYPRHGPAYCSCSSTKIISVEDGLQNVDTFCFTEPKRHMGVFNGILTGQCVEVMEYTDDDNIASCNLSSIPISRYVKFTDNDRKKPYFDFEELGQTTRRTMRNLKQMIDRNYYPEDVPQIKATNMRNRPIGIGIQDLAGCFALMDIIWDSDEARLLNEKIANVMYYHGMDENVKMAKEFGAYETFKGSPASKGYFQFDLWSLEKINKTEDEAHYSELPKNKEFDYEPIRTNMIKDGLYFSLVFSQMPTASSAHILGNNESTEPYTRLMYSRTVLSGQFIVSVSHFVKDLEEIGLWNDDMLKHLFRNQGSIQTFPEDGLDGPIRFRLRYLKEKYRTAFELKQKMLANLYLDRAKYQCQSASNNAFISKPTLTTLSAYHFHMWKGGAKTGMYYLHQTPGSEPLNFSLDSVHVSKRKQETVTTTVCTSCSS